MQAILVAHACALAITAVAAVMDFRTGHIPNWLTLPPLAIAPLGYGLIHGFEGFLLAIVGVGACGLVPYLLFRKDAMAGGDVKLFAAIGAMTGVFIGIEAQLLSIIVAAVYALGRLAWSGKLVRTVGNSFYVMANPVLPTKWKRNITPELLHKIRLGVPIFVGTALALLDRHRALVFG